MNEPLLFVEAARGIGMTLVVVVHVCLYICTNLSEWRPFGPHAVAIYGLAVPLFFLLSGLIYGQQEARAAARGETLDGRRFLLRKLRTLLVPMWIWTAIQLGVGELVDRPLSSGEKLFRVFFGDWQLYFIVALAQYFALSMLLRRHWARRGFAPTLAVATLVTFAFYGVSSYILWARGGDEGFETHWNRLFAAWAVWYFAGVALGRVEGALDRFGRRLWLWALLAAAAYPLWHWELRKEELTLWATPHLQFSAGAFPYQLFGALALLAAFWRLQRARFGRPIIAALARLGPDSFGVYLSHTSLLMLLHWQWTRHELTETAWGSVWVVGGLTWLASVLFVRALHLRGLRVLGTLLFRPAR